jgi:hypothetical protein
MAIYEVAYSTKSASNDELSFSDILLVEAETREELYTKVVDTLLRTLVVRVKRLRPSTLRQAIEMTHAVTDSSV